MRLKEPLFHSIEAWNCTYSSIKPQIIPLPYRSLWSLEPQTIPQWTSTCSAKSTSYLPYSFPHRNPAGLATRPHLAWSTLQYSTIITIAHNHTNLVLTGVIHSVSVAWDFWVDCSRTTLHLRYPGCVVLKTHKWHLEASIVRYKKLLVRYSQLDIQVITSYTVISIVL